MKKLPIPTIDEIQAEKLHERWEDFQHHEDASRQGYRIDTTTWEEDYIECLTDYNNQSPVAVQMMERFWVWSLTK